MEPNSRNIYRTGRRIAGMTQERWAEALGISVESVIGYEGGRQIPSDDVVKAMCEISGLSALAHWHLYNKSALARELLPEVEVVPLAQAVCALVSRMESFVRDCPAQLLRMAADGKIDEMERKDFADVMASLDGIVQAAMTLRHADAGGGRKVGDR